MNAYSLFAESQFHLKEPTIDDINNIFAFILAAFAVGLIGMLLWHFVPLLISYYRDRRAEKIKVNSTIWFDTTESVLYRGSQQLKIPENTIEFFVCKLIFDERDKYQLDENVLDAYGGDSFKQRPVYQAVVRLNKKVKSELKLKEDLFIRGRERTALNNNFR
jgi:hypothetical protein